MDPTGVVRAQNNQVSAPCAVPSLASALSPTLHLHLLGHTLLTRHLVTSTSSLSTFSDTLLSPQTSWTFSPPPPHPHLLTLLRLTSHSPQVLGSPVRSVLREDPDTQARPHSHIRRVRPRGGQGLRRHRNLQLLSQSRIDFSVDESLLVSL